MEQTAPDTVTSTLPASIALGFPQEVAAAWPAGPRNPREKSISRSPPIPMPPSARRALSGVSIVPQGDEAKFPRPAAAVGSGAIAGMLETLERWASAGSATWPLFPRWASPSGSVPKGCGCGNWRAARRSASWCRWRRRSSSKTKSSWRSRGSAGAPGVSTGTAAQRLAARLATRALATDELRLRLKLETAHVRAARCACPCRRSTQIILEAVAARPGCASARSAHCAHLDGMNPVNRQAAQGGLFIPRWRRTGGS